jgi:hypothetical protein
LEAILPIVVVLPEPLTPTKRTTRGLGPSLKSTICSRGFRMAAISVASAALISSPETSRSKRSREKALVMRAATLAPMSEVMSSSSSSSSDSRSILRLERPERPSARREEERLRPSLSR